MKRLFILLLLPGILCSCIHFDGKEQEMQAEASINPKVKAYWDKRVSEGEAALEQQHYNEASALFARFEEEYPHSIYLNRSKLDHGRALAGEGKYSESLQLYKDVIDSSLELHPEFVGLASYYASFSYEALGDEAKTLASLKDAKTQAQFLPTAVAKAELPARMAAYYHRQGELDESRKYYREAEQGMTQLYQTDTPADKKAKARTYFLMGVLSSNQVTIDNLPLQMDTLALTQIFLLRSVELNQNPWSTQSLENLEGNYRDIWNAIIQIPKNNTLDALAAEGEQREAQVRAIGHLQELTQKMRVYQSPEQNKDNANEAALFNFLDQIDSHSQEMLASLTPNLPLTPEAQKRETLHREGVRDVSPNAVPKKDSAKPVVDPNLQGDK
jgi:tetratricopeptide (TPR) repeat protein